MKNFAYGLIMIVLLGLITFAGYLLETGLDRPPGADGKLNDMVFLGGLIMAFSVIALMIVCGYAIGSSGRK